MDHHDVNRLTIYTEPGCLYSHQVRLALHEKDIEALIIEKPFLDWPEDIISASPYGRGPMLVDRDLILFNAQVIIDYLDERYPLPALKPADPASRAQQQMLMYRIDHDWYTHIKDIDTANIKTANRLKKQLIEELTALSALFEHYPFFNSEQFSMLDCAFAPILWYLKKHDAALPDSATALRLYSEKLFNRPSFKASLINAKQGLMMP